MLTQISLTLSPHSYQSFIASGRFSRLHPVSVIDGFLLVSQHWHVYVQRFIRECHL